MCVFLSDRDIFRSFLFLEGKYFGRLKVRLNFIEKKYSPVLEKNICGFFFTILKTIKKEFVNLKQSFLTGVEIANNPNIFFVQNHTEININTVFEIEKSAPLLQKDNQTLETLVPLNDLEFFQNNVPANFKFENFKLCMKKEKNIIDKIRLFFI